MKNQSTKNLEEFIKLPKEYDHLDLSNQIITDENCIMLRNVLLDNNVKNIKILHLNNCQITDEGISSLADGLKDNNLINFLYIQNNKIGNVGITKIAKILKNMKNLSELGLNDNQISSVGISALVEELKGNKNSLKLWISNNNLGDEGTIILTKNLKDMNISDLGLAMNKITDIGANVLIDEISNSNINTNLYLGQNYISSHYVSLIKTKLNHLSYIGLDYQNSMIEDIKMEQSSLIQIVDDISLKLESFNKAQKELEIQNIDEEDSVSNVFHLSNNSNLKLPITLPILLNQSQPNQPIVNEQPLNELERALAEIKALREINAAKDIKIKELVDFLNKKENDLKAKDLIISNLYENNNELKNHIEEIREDKKELKLEKYEWKAKYEAKDDSLQKTIEELTIEKAKVSELVQKFVVHNHDSHGISSFSIIDQEHVDVSNTGEEALENQIFD